MDRPRSRLQVDHLAQVIVDATIVLGDVFSRWSDGAGNVLTAEDAEMLASIAENALRFLADLMYEIAAVLG